LGAGLEERDIALDMRKNVRKMISFTGIRRAGKTYMMFQLINQLSEATPRENIFYVNFEEKRLDRSKETITQLLPTMTKLYGDGDRNPFLFLDEVQLVEEGL